MRNNEFLYGNCIRNLKDLDKYLRSLFRHKYKGLALEERTILLLERFSRTPLNPHHLPNPMYRQSVDEDSILRNYREKCRKNLPLKIKARNIRKVSLYESKIMKRETRNKIIFIRCIEI